MLPEAPQYIIRWCTMHKNYFRAIFKRDLAWKYAKREKFRNQPTASIFSFEPIFLVLRPYFQIYTSYHHDFATVVKACVTWSPQVPHVLVYNAQKFFRRHLKRSLAWKHAKSETFRSQPTASTFSFEPSFHFYGHIFKSRRRIIMVLPPL